MWSTVRRGPLLSVLLAFAVLAALGACGGATSERAARDEPRAPAGVPQDLAKVWEAYQALRQRYVDKESLDPEKLSAGAIRGMLQALGDPYTAYLDSSSFRAQADEGAGTFEGIGATVNMQDGRPTIVEPLPNSPADRSGLRTGDVIRKINGDPIEGLTLQQVVERVRGPGGTAVRLTVQPSAGGQERDVSIVRATIHLSTVTTRVLGGGVAVLRIGQFARQTTSDLDEALDTLQASRVRGIVLDLRGNPGGLLNVVVHTASQFLKEGLVLYEVNAAGKRTDWNVEKGGRFTEAPLVVLVNGASASGSEVVAGAIQASGRGKVVGTRTFGKGVVSVPVPLKDGSGLFVTTATWFTPSGAQIGKVGLTPDIEVRRTLEDFEAGRDPQLDRALELLGQAVAPR